jgi:hypothetical protein
LRPVKTQICGGRGVIEVIIPGGKLNLRDKDIVLAGDIFPLQLSESRQGCITERNFPKLR